MVRAIGKSHTLINNDLSSATNGFERARTGTRGAVLCLQQGRVLIADLLEIPPTFFPIQVANVVGAPKGKPMRLSQLIPEFFKVDRTIGIAFAHKQVDHFTEGPN